MQRRCSTSSSVHGPLAVERVDELRGQARRRRRAAPQARVAPRAPRCRLRTCRRRSTSGAPALAEACARSSASSASRSRRGQRTGQRRARASRSRHTRRGNSSRSLRSTSSASARCVVSLPPTIEYNPRAARWRRMMWRRVIAAFRAARLVRQRPHAGLRVEHAARETRRHRETRAPFRSRGKRARAHRSRPRPGRLRNARRSCRSSSSSFHGRMKNGRWSAPGFDVHTARAARRRTAARRCGCPSCRRSGACAESARAPRRPTARPH